MTSNPIAGDRAATGPPATQVPAPAASFHQAILLAAMDGFWMVDTQQRILEVNDAYCRMSGYTAQELLTMRVADLEAREAEPTVVAHLEQIKARREDRFESQHRRKDGSLFEVEISVQYRPEGGGRYVAFMRDITEKKRAQQEAARGYELLVNLATLVPGVIYQYRLYPDGRSAFPYSSPGMNTICELAPEDVREDASPVFGRVHPDDLQAVSDAIQESARTLQTFYSEFRVVLPRQGLRWRWSQAHPQRMPDGGTLWHGIISDITERKLVEAERARLEDQLRQAQKMESVGRLAGGVAHDFNNMLSVILGHAELALGAPFQTAQLQQHLREIHKAASRSADLTRQLLAFARKQTIAPRVLDLNETVESMLTMLRRLIGEDIELRWRPGRHAGRVAIDPTQVDQVLANLCVNARDAIDGVGIVTIETDAADIDEAYCATHPGATPGAYLRLSVSDDGCGMDEAVLSHLFEPFFTTKTVGSGTGLGLATVFGIVKQNLGFVEVRSVPGEGTTFSVFLPSHEEEARRSRTRPAERNRRGHETVLLVEDESALLGMTSRILTAHGYLVLAAGSPTEALRRAEEHPGAIDLLMTDVIMPGMNGRELAVELRARYPQLKLLFTSGYTDDVIAPHGVLETGMSFLQKPFSVTALTEKVREALDQG